MMRRAPNLTELYTAALIQLGFVDRERAKGMTAKQLVRVASPDHYPIAFATGRDMGLTAEQIHHPSNITLVTLAQNLENNNKRDTPVIAKGKRLSDAQIRFRAALAVKGEEPQPKSNWSGRKLVSRGGFERNEEQAAMHRRFREIRKIAEKEGITNVVIGKADREAHDRLTGYYNGRPFFMIICASKSVEAHPRIKFNLRRNIRQAIREHAGA